MKPLLNFAGHFLLLWQIAATAPSAYAASPADEYPSRAITLIHPYAPGSGADVTFRQVADRLGHKLGQAFVVLNRTGGSAVIGHVAVANAKPDGYTLGGISTPIVSNPVTMKDPQVIFGRDLAPIGLISSFYLVIVGNKSLPASTLPELIAQAKRSSKPLNFGMLKGGSVEFAKLLIDRLSGVSFSGIPYRGTPDILKDILGGNLDVGLISPQNVPLGEVKVFAYLGKKRTERLPEVPTLSEFYSDSVFGGWLGLTAPAAIPKDILAKISAAFREVMKDPMLLDYITHKALNEPAEDASPEYMTKILEADAKIYRDLAKINGIKPTD